MEKTNPQTNPTAGTVRKPRVSLQDFERYIMKKDPQKLLDVMTYLFCVDGCRPDEVGQRFSMTEALATRQGADEERIARWHKLFDEMWQVDPESFVRVAFQVDRTRHAEQTMLQFMSDVVQRSAEYLIHPYLPKGMITVLGGVSGVGKTWLALLWASFVSNQFAADEPGAVYYFTQENDPSIVLLPRLKSLGAELSRIAVQKMDEQGVTLDDPRLETAALMVPPKLVIFDPIQSYLGARVEMNKANEVRPILDWLGRFAQRYNCAVVLVSHMSKPGANNTDALDRLLGSSDFRNAARSIVIVGRDPDEPNVRVFAHAKNSIGEPGPSYRYRVGDDGIEMLGECDLTANDIIKVASGKPGRPVGSAAVEDLRAFLEPRGWATADEVWQMCDKKGYTHRTIQRAGKQLRVKHLQAGGGKNRRDWWLLPDTPEKAVKVG
ncbi:AAA family ATPase [Gemmiger sp.]